MKKRFDAILCDKPNILSEFKGSVKIDKSLNVGGDLAISGNLTFGDAAVDSITINGTSTVTSNVKLCFRSSGIYIHSNDVGKLTICADGTADDTIKISGKTTFTSPVILTVSTSARGTPVEGDLKWNSTTHKLQVYNGSAWETVSSS